MVKDRFPATPAVRVLKQSKIPYTLHVYDYEDKGGTQRAAQELNVDEHQVVKTLVMEDEQREPVVILMHGDRQVSTKAFARALMVKTVKPCAPDMAHKHTGYVVGGTSPLGLKKRLNIYFESSIADLPFIFINAGKRGLLARLSPKELIQMLDATPVNVAN
ncbi:MAG: Cys-tRNA(Pro) deacylase [Deltaproteobacteria bacterium]|nr:Cys-tRNA(Pro) deacylase [Deltaproteobacteria bacterium]